MGIRVMVKCLPLSISAVFLCSILQTCNSPQSSSASTMVHTSSGDGIPSSLGWYQIPNTKLESVCPPNNFGDAGYDFHDSCRYVIAAWGGGIADTKRNRLVVWGGGHSDYSGNEVYALDLNSLQMVRLNDPTVPVTSGCAEALQGQMPNSRHTYGNLSYVPSLDEMVSVTGSLAACGGGSTATWTLELSNLKWTQQSPRGTAPFYGGGLAGTDYDQNTGNVYVSDESYGEFATYDPRANTYKLLSKGNPTSTGMTAVIDPKRKLFFLFGGDPGNGGGVRVIDISGHDRSYKVKGLSVAGCGPVLTAVYPGVAYDPIQDRIVIWTGGDAVFLFNPDTKSCTSVSYPNGPGAPQNNGTNGRFRYFPALGVFALVNDARQNAYVLRLTQASDTADFQSRCTAPGVIKCVGWDDPSDFIPASGGGGYADGLYPADDKTIQGTMDKSIKTSGEGSLKFTIRPYATANATGYWRANFGPLEKRTAFGPHSTLYLQFRFRVDENMLNFDWTKVSNQGWKVFIVYGPIPGPSCTGAQFVQENAYQTNIPRAYTSCGEPGLYTNNGVPPYLNEQGDYHCSYNSEGKYSAPSCFVYPANVWMTEYWIVHTGDYGQPNTQFTAYIARQGEPLKKFIDLPNFKFNGGPDPHDALETMLLQPFMSGATGTRPNPTAHMWFDELIISTKPIAPPKN
jgi:hypothetical protein